jgi:hypothetical protein
VGQDNPGSPARQAPPGPLGPGDRKVVPDPGEVLDSLGLAERQGREGQQVRLGRQEGRERRVFRGGQGGPGLLGSLEWWGGLGSLDLRGLLERQVSE